MRNHVIVIPGKPISKQRPRFARQGKFVRVYSAQEKEEKSLKYEIKIQWPWPPLSCPVRIYVLALFPVTKASAKKVEAMLNGETKHVKRPDFDNIEKIYADAFNGLVWVDDSQVWKSEVEKGFAREPQTIIRLEW